MSEVEMSDNVSKEPANTATTKEPVAEEIKKIVAPRLGSGLYLCCAVLVLILVVIGTPTTFLYNQDAKNGVNVYVSLWKTSISERNGTTVHDNKDILCEAIADRFQTAQGFSIISIGVALIAIAVGFLNHRFLNQLKCLVFLVNLLLCAATLITWGAGVSIYMGTFCDRTKTLYEEHYLLSDSAGLFIAAWIVTIIAPFLMLLDPVRPTLAKFATTLGVLVTGVAFIFTIAGTSGVWIGRYYGESRDSDYAETTFTLWGKSNTDSLGVKTVIAYTDLNDCKEFAEMWRVAAGFAIISIGGAFLTFIVSLYNAVVTDNTPRKKADGSVSKVRTPLLKTALFFGFLTSWAMLITWAIVARIFYNNFCNKAYDLKEEYYGLKYSMALFVVGWVLLVIGNIALAWAILFGSKASCLGKMNPVGAFFVVGIFVAAVFSVVGAGITWFASNESGTKVEYTPWYKTVSTNGQPAVATSVGDFTCDQLRFRFRAIEAFTILSCLFAVFATLAGARRLFRDDWKGIAGGLGVTASLWQLIAWAIGASLYNQGFCGANAFSTNVEIGPGLGLYVAAWCLTLVVSGIQLGF